MAATTQAAQRHGGEDRATEKAAVAADASSVVVGESREKAVAMVSKVRAAMARTSSGAWAEEAMAMARGVETKADRGMGVKPRSQRCIF